jgi:glycosyltransferase involved in cell wall biosynthesis
VLAQTYDNWECIIVDDGSSDNTDEVVGEYVKKDSRFKYYHRPDEHLPGGNGARNYGFNICKGDLIKWFDSDDIMNNKLLHLQCDNLKINNKKISLCLFSRYSSDLKRIEVRNLSFPKVINSYHSFLKQELLANLQTLLFERNTVCQLNFDEKLLKSQEYDFIQKLLKVYNQEISFLEKSLVIVRRHKQSITGKFRTDQTISSLVARLNAYRNLSMDTPPDVKLKIMKNYFFILSKLLLNKEKLFFKYVDKGSIFNFKSHQYYILKFKFLFYYNLLFNRGYNKYRQNIDKLKI